jgi:RimJ/RimL family protein N-acetyltransferase
VIAFAFKTYDINRVFVRPYGTNAASQRVLERQDSNWKEDLKKQSLRTVNILMN